MGEFMNAYCVMLCRQPFVNPAYPRTKRFYVGAPTADRAIRAASDENPHFRVMGIEHSDLYPRLTQNDRSPSMWQAA
jgi:hypothetical protein